MVHDMINSIVSRRIDHVGFPADNAVFRILPRLSLDLVTLVLTRRTHHRLNVERRRYRLEGQPDKRIEIQ